MGTYETRRPALKAVLCILMLANQLAMAAVMGEASKTIQTPTFNFDFSSMQSRDAVGSKVNDIRSSWGNFFSERPKPVFTDELTNVVKGSENELRGTQNELEGSKNKVIGIGNSLFGD